MATPDFDLYEALGCARTAKQAQVTRAFRKAAQRTHPDRGGSQEAFEKVRLAYSVLGDPKKRAVYDATGQFDDASAHNLQGQVLQVLSSIVMATVAQLAASGMPSQRFDWMKHLRTSIKLSQENAEQQIEQMQRCQKKFFDLASRFKRIGAGENLMQQIANHHVAGCAEEIKKAQHSLDTLAKASVLLNDYTFDLTGFRDLAPQFRSINFSAVTNY